mmetsp:Transcript_1883/g.8468  ORF Transcript_1883/g.8468 Transcript_1883/m.8468 type:complete len:281 (-) Transcript_1883:142-984(-)
MSSHTECSHRAVTSATSPFGLEKAPSTCLYRRCRLGGADSSPVLTTPAASIESFTGDKSPGTSPGTTMGSHTWFTPSDAVRVFPRRLVTTPTTFTSRSRDSRALASSFHVASGTPFASSAPCLFRVFHSVTTTSPPRLARNPTAESPFEATPFVSSDALRSSSNTGMARAMGSDAHGNTSSSSSPSSSSPSITTSPFSNSAYLSAPESSRAIANLHLDLYPRVFGDANTSIPLAGMNPASPNSVRTFSVLSASSVRYPSSSEDDDGDAVAVGFPVKGFRR